MMRAVANRSRTFQAANRAAPSSPALPVSGDVSFPDVAEEKARSAGPSCLTRGALTVSGSPSDDPVEEAAGT